MHVPALGLKTILTNHVTVISQFNSGQEAYELALKCSETEDHIIVFGSFHVLEEVLNEV